MCVKASWIRNKYTGEWLFVKCGHCPACQQEKALRRYARVSKHCNTYHGRFFVFVTLSYDNKYLPYVDVSDIPAYDKASNSWYLPIYRDYRRELRKNRYKTKKAVVYDKHIIGYVYPKKLKNLSETEYSDRYGLCNPPSDIYEGTVSPVGHDNIDAIGVAYYNEVTGYKKRLQTYLKRYYNITINNENFHYYAVSEYGPSTFRPHFHLLLDFDASLSKKFYQLRRASIASWPFCNYSQLSRYFEIAYDPASYITSYVNRGSFFPFFLESNQICPRCSHSVGYGYDLRNYSSDYIHEALERRNLYETVKRQTKNGLLQFNVPIPQYITRRYFPYIKGLRNLSDSEVFTVLSSPRSIYTYRHEMDYSSEDLYQFFLTIERCYERYGCFRRERRRSTLDFAIDYVRHMRLRQFMVLRESYSDVVDDRSFIEHFDNLDNLFAMDNVVFFEHYNIDPFDIIDTDSNHFTRNVVRTQELEEKYNNNMKQRKCNDYVDNLVLHYH